MPRRISGGPTRGNIAWTGMAPLLVNSWRDYGAPFALSAYGIDPDGIVHLRGLLAQTAANVPSNQVCAVLPAGYRPGANNQPLFACVCAYGTGSMMGTRVDIQPDGSIVIYNLTGTSTTFSYMSLAGIYFPAEQ